MWYKIFLERIIRMIFTIMNRERKTLEDRGYKLIEDSKRVIDYELYEKIVSNKGEKYAETLTQRFSEELEPVCIGEDGIFYTVLFEKVDEDNEGEIPRAFLWQEVTLINHPDKSNK